MLKNGWCVTFINGRNAQILKLDGKDFSGMSVDDTLTLGTILTKYGEAFYITNHKTLSKRYTLADVLEASRVKPPMRAG